MKRIYLFVIVAVSLLHSACDMNNPTKNFEGVWEPNIGEKVEAPDLFVITSDSIKAIEKETGLEHYQSHYKFVKDSIIELERTWLGHSDSEWYVSEQYMYFEENNNLIIKYFEPVSPISQIFPNYAILRMKRHH